MGDPRKGLRGWMPYYRLLRLRLCLCIRRPVWSSVVKQIWSVRVEP